MYHILFLSAKEIVAKCHIKTNSGKSGQVSETCFKMKHEKSIHHITLKSHPPVLCYGNQLLYFSFAIVNAIHGLGHLCIKVSQLSLSTRLEEGEEVWLDL